MELQGKTAVVTGAASGIGRALARRFAAEGARVVVSDVDLDGALRVAGDIEGERAGSAIPVGCDVSVGGEVGTLIDRAEAAFGPVDLFCANAGVGGGFDLDTPDEDWELAWGVNVQAHVHAARRLVPQWVERGEGYFLSTASAAGLLTAIGSAPYAVTKHAAVAFAEWLAITYGDRGVRVSCLCPMAVDTPLLNEGLELSGPERLATKVIVSTATVIQPDEVADAAVEGLRDERFLILPHAEVADYLRGKATDPDAWVASMRRLQAYHLRELEEIA
jgi:NAD(P)-dependent dehydrogenase (short-subunit alcohol dehydrogenase family)